mmetsp:Transcript_13210/g.55334  ORF Transcript_13210/g.55334 Transcript_13210/m.55334 type:complete len:234 (-) Transcript_13210:983-1684(-)
MGSDMNFLHTGRISLLSVAENIITCFLCGVFTKIDCTSLRMSRVSSTLSHSSMMKWSRFDRSRSPLLARSRMRPGVPTTMCGQSFLSMSTCVWRGTPPKITATLTSLMYTEKRSNSWQIWKASSRVWHSTSALTLPALGSSCCSVDSVNTAVLPMPDLAWQMTSMPRIACGMHSCWTVRRGEGKQREGVCARVRVRACVRGAGGMVRQRMDGRVGGLVVDGQDIGWRGWGGEG